MEYVLAVLILLSDAFIYLLYRKLSASKAEAPAEKPEKPEKKEKSKNDDNRDALNERLQLEGLQSIMNYDVETARKFYRGELGE